MIYLKLYLVDVFLEVVMSCGTPFSASHFLSQIDWQHCISVWTSLTQVGTGVWPPENASVHPPPTPLILNSLPPSILRNLHFPHEKTNQTLPTVKIGLVN